MKSRSKTVDQMTDPVGIVQLKLGKTGSEEVSVFYIFEISFQLF